MRLRIATIAVLGIGGRAFGQQYPPPFPRDGVSKAVETDRFIVWVGVLGFKSRPSAVFFQPCGRRDQHDAPQVREEKSFTIPRHMLYKSYVGGQLDEFVT